MESHARHEDPPEAPTAIGASDPDDTGNGNGAMSPSALRPVRAAAAIARILITSLALVVLYVAAPVNTTSTVGAIVIMVLAGAVFATVFTHHVRVLHRTPYPVLRAANLLATSLTVFILGFSLTYIALAEVDPSSFSEPVGKVSAVYFTVTTLTTVGFGDITATTDLTRAVVTLQMLSGVTLIGVLVRYVVNLTSRRVRSVRDSN